MIQAKLPSSDELRRLEHEGSYEERQSVGKLLIKKIERADPTLHGPDSGWGRYPTLLKLALSLTFDPEKTPLTITDGSKVLGSEIDNFTPGTRRRVVAAKHRRVGAQNARVKAHAAATASDASSVSQRPRTRERRETRRASRSSSSSDDGPGEHEPALGRQQTPGEIAERLRLQRGFSQAKLGILCGLTQGGVSRIESGSSADPRPATKVEIAEVLGVRVSEIWPS